jgi:hypothetical protein
MIERLSTWEHTVCVPVPGGQRVGLHDNKTAQTKTKSQEPQPTKPKSLGVWQSASFLERKRPTRQQYFIITLTPAHRVNIVRDVVDGSTSSCSSTGHYRCVVLRCVALLWQYAQSTFQTSAFIPEHFASQIGGLPVYHSQIKYSYCMQTFLRMNMVIFLGLVRVIKYTKKSERSRHSSDHPFSFSICALENGTCTEYDACAGRKRNYPWNAIEHNRPIGLFIGHPVRA